MYYVRAIVAWCLSAVGILLWMLTAVAALDVVVNTIEDFSHAAVLWVFLGVLLAVTVAVNFGFDVLAAMLLPAASRGPRWLRDGLWGGRYSAAVPWSSTHHQIATMAGRICCGLVGSIVVGVLVRAVLSRKLAGGRELISDGLIGMLCLLAFGAYVVWMSMLGWKFVHDRFRPPPVDPGFDPVRQTEPPEILT